MKKLIACVLLLLGSLNAQFATSKSYGQGCKNARLVIDAPRIGSKIFATLPNLPKGSFGSVLLGISLIQQNQSIGNGCSLLIYPMWNWVHNIPSTHRGPNGIYMGQIVDDPGLIGLVFFAQAVYQNEDLLPSWTNGVKCTVGH